MRRYLPATTLLALTLAMIGSTAQASPGSLPPPAFRWSLAATIEDAVGKPTPIAGPIVGATDGRLIVAGGTNFPKAPPWEGGRKAYYDEVHVYANVDGKPTPVANTTKLPEPLAYSAGVNTPAGIVSAGGENVEGPTAQVLLLRWDAAHRAVAISHLPDLPEPSSSGLIAAVGDDVYFAGGNGAKETLDGVYRLDLHDQRAGWQLVSHLPIPVSHGVMYGIGTGSGASLYVVGGRTRHAEAPSTFHANVYRLNLATGAWSSMAPLPYPLSAFTGVTWGNDTLLVFSGDHGHTFHKVETALIAIAHESNATEKARLVAEKNALLKNHPGFRGTVLAYDTHTNAWTSGPSIPFPGQVTTMATTWDGRVIIAGGEIRPGIRSADIVMGTVRRR